MEIWRDIENYVGLYEVSNFGRVRSLDRAIGRKQEGKFGHIKGKVLKPRVDKRSGYFSVTLSKAQKRKAFSVHRLVAFAFPEICGEKFEDCVIDHLDTNRLNNVATNLKVCTRSQNMRNPISMVRLKENIRRAVAARAGLPAWNKGRLLPNLSGENHWRSKPVLQYDKNGNFIKEWANTRVAAFALHILSSSIYNCLTGRSMSAGGYVWKRKQ